MDYRVCLPRRTELVVYTANNAQLSVGEAIFGICKHFELDALVLDRLALCVAPSATHDGAVLERHHVLRAAVQSSDVLALYEAPVATAVVVDESNGRESAPRALMLDHKSPLHFVAAIVKRASKTSKADVDHGFVLADSAEAFTRQQWWWLNGNHCLADFPVEQHSVLGVFSHAWWRSIPKAAVHAHATKSGWLERQGTAKFLERGGIDSPDESDLLSTKRQSRFVLFAPPKLFLYKSEFDTVPEDVVSVDLFCMHLHNTPRLALVRTTRLEEIGGKEQLKRTASNLKRLGMLEGHGLKQTAQNVMGAKPLAQLSLYETVDVLREWYEVIRPDAQNTGVLCVFGAPLHHVVSRQLGASLVPSVVSDTIEFLDEHGLDMEGIFRQSGSHALVEYMRDLYDTGSSLRVLALPPSFAYSVAALLKLYLRVLPEPLLTHKLYASFIKASLIANKEARVAKVLDLCNSELPDEQAVVLRCLLGFLRRVSSLAAKNLMTRQNLALMFGPNLLRIPDSHMPDATASQLRDTALVNDVVAILIEHAHELRPRSPLAAPTASSNSVKELPTPPVLRKALPTVVPSNKHVDSEIKELVLALQQQLTQEREERLQREARILAVLREEREARIQLEEEVRALWARLNSPR